MAYGSRKRSTHFDISFVTFKSDDGSPFEWASSNSKLKQVVQQLSRPYIYTTIQSDTYTNARSMYKVLKKYRFTIAPSQTTDIDSSTGKVKEIKLFFKHNKRYNMQPTAIEEPETDVLGHAQADGLDFGNDPTTYNHPSHNQRVIMIIRAFAPERASAAGTPAVSADRDPTYDILIRNKFTLTR